jgi:hypothetical protein
VVITDGANVLQLDHVHYSWKKRRAPTPVKHRGQTMQNDDIQEQFNEAVAAGDYRLAERIARIWLLRLQATTNDDAKVVPAAADVVGVQS